MELSIALIVSAFFGFFNCISMRINFTISLVAMVNYTAVDEVNATSDECPNQGNVTNTTVSQVKVVLILII